MSNQEHQLGKLPCREATADRSRAQRIHAGGPRDAATSGAVDLLQVMGRPSSGEGKLLERNMSLSIANADTETPSTRKRTKQ
jgi:hypothetical protein